MGDIPTGGTRSIKNMWEKGNVGSSSESPAPANKVRDWESEKDRRVYFYVIPYLRCLFSQDVAGIKGGVAGRVNSWMAKPAEPEKAAPAAAEAAAKPAVRPDKSCSWSHTLL